MWKKERPQRALNQSEFLSTLTTGSLNIEEKGFDATASNVELAQRYFHSLRNIYNGNRLLYIKRIKCFYEKTEKSSFQTQK